MRFLEFISSTAPVEVLVENKATYKQMLQGLVQTYQKVNPNKATEIQQQAAHIRNTYQRSDRIIWALRWLRLHYVLEMRQELRQVDDETGAPFVNWANKAFEKYKQELINNYTGYGSMSDDQIIEQVNEFSSSRFARNIAHFMAYTDQNDQNYISKIAEYTFGWQLPSEIMRDFNSAEKQWQENRAREMDHADEFYDNAEILLQFDDGWAWWNLNQEYCNAEGAAMGHCGNNQGRGGSGDTVLSLRQEIERGDKMKQIPYLTFILESDGRLGEMKGRNNAKPSEKYHKYIVPLLMSKYVTGIKGGGHDPGNNFQMSDLDRETKEDLIAKKPELAGLYELYDSEGMTKRVEAMLYDEISNHDMHQIHGLDDDRDTAILAYYNDLEDMSREIYWKPLDAAVDAQRDREEGNQPDTDFEDEEIGDVSLPADMMEDIFRHLSPRYAERIAADMGIEGDTDDFGVQREMAQRFEKQSKYADTMALGVLTVHAEDNTTSDITEEEWKAYLEAVVDAVQSGLNIHQAWIRAEDDGAYSLCMHTSELVDVVSASQDEDEYYYYRHFAQTDGWDSFESYNADETWKEIIEGNRSWAASDDGKAKKVHDRLGTDDDIGDQIKYDKIDTKQIALWFMKYVDLHEAKEDDLDQLITEMLKRAGIS